jgi:hypothetical protein
MPKLGSVNMKAVDESRVRLLLRASLGVGLTLSLLNAAGAIDWIVIGRGANLAIGLTLALVALSGWLSSRWLSRRGLAL